MNAAWSSFEKIFDFLTVDSFLIGVVGKFEFTVFVIVLGMNVWVKGDNVFLFWGIIVDAVGGVSVAVGTVAGIFDLAGLTIVEIAGRVIVEIVGRVNVGMGGRSLAGIASETVGVANGDDVDKVD